MPNPAVYCIVYTVYVCTVHTLKPEINLNLRIKTRRVTVGADATVYVWFLCQIYCDQKAAKYRCISALQPVIYRSPAVTDPVLYEDSDYFWDSVCTLVL